MDKKELITGINSNTKEVECLIKVLKSYCIDEANEIEDVKSTMLPTSGIILDKINEIKDSLYKIKND